MSTMRLEIVTPERKIYSEDVDMVSLRGQEGELGILPNHAPIVTPLAVSAIRIKQGSEISKIAISGGFLEVSNNKAVILAETAELPVDIDVDRAMQAKNRAEQFLNDKDTDNIDVKRAQLSLQRALVRLDVASKN